MLTSGIKRFLLRDSLAAKVIVRLTATPGPITMLMLVRDECDIIKQNIEFHQRFGIQNFVVTDNGSVDGTRDLLGDLQRHLGSSMNIIDDAEPVHRQAARVSRMIKVAKEKFRTQWIISSDADELWYPVSGRYDTEIDGKKNVLDCYWHNFLPRFESPWQEFSDIGEMPGYHARMKKCFCLARGLLGMYAGNHESRSIPHVSFRSQNIRVYHYPIRSYTQFQRKVVQGYRSIIGAGNDENTGWQWREYYKLWESGKLETIYKELVSQNKVCTDSTMAELLGTSEA